MGLTMHERHAVIRQLSSRFQRSSKKERGRMLNEVVHLTGYTRSYAAFVLRNCGTKHVRIVGGRRVIFIPGQARPGGSKRQRTGHYSTKAFLEVLQQFWALSDGLCGKRLTVFLREVLPLIERQGTMPRLDGTIRNQLLHVSPATVDRLLAKTKCQSRLTMRSRTRPGTLLKHHIPVKTFADWDNVQPGFCEMDLVAHDGSSAFGEYCQSLNLTDVASAWTETMGVQNKAQVHVFDGLQQIRTQLPFPLRGLNSDNGGEFINDQLNRYCQAEHITFTRGRPYKKNDNCYVEQKNYSIVRRTVGHYRYDTPEQLRLLNELYRLLRLYTNFFLPVMKLQEKRRVGSKLTRRYDAPQTPFRRLLAHPGVSAKVKDNLIKQYDTLDLVALKRQLNRLQQKLFRSAVKAGPPPRPPGPPHFAPYPGPNHPWRNKARVQRHS